MDIIDTDETHAAKRSTATMMGDFVTKLLCPNPLAAIL